MILVNQHFIIKQYSRNNLWTFNSKVRKGKKCPLHSEANHVHMWICISKESDNVQNYGNLGTYYQH
jgi:hypothetical protein